MTNQIIQDKDGNVYEVQDEKRLPSRYGLNRHTAQLKDAKQVYQDANEVDAGAAWDAVLAAAGVEYFFMRPITGFFDGVHKLYTWNADTGDISMANERPSVALYEQERDALAPGDANGRKYAQDRVDALNRLGVDHARIPDIEAEVEKGP